MMILFYYLFPLAYLVVIALFSYYLQLALLFHILKLINNSLRKYKGN